MRSKVRKAFDGLYEKTETTYRAMQTRKDAKHIIKSMGSISHELQKTYTSEIVPYWAKFKKKPPIYWFRLFLETVFYRSPVYS